MKKSIVVLLNILLLMSMTVTVFAEGDPNLDGGGGGMDSGTGTNSWTPGRDGVRVTIVRADDNRPVSTPVDFTNNPPYDITVHFGKASKIAYRSGTAITPNTGTYTCVRPVETIPTIVNSSGGNNISAIRSYFTDEIAIKDIADATGFNYDLLISGEYKLLLEPVAYFKYGGIVYAMTATEAALFDQKVGGGLRNAMGYLSHQNLPLAMFLEFDELGFSAWHGSTTDIAANENIIMYLGMGIIRFTELEIEPQESEIRYRTDTEVITSVSLTTGTEKTPEDPAYATFSINGSTYSHTDIYIPENGSQLAWVKWKTPPTPGTVTITISSNCTPDKNVIVAEIVDLNKNIPPDPQANDRNDGYRIPAAPVKANVTTLTWGEWDCWWHEYWVWISTGSCGNEDCTSDHGYWEDQARFVSRQSA